jgi:hypothetical protein
MTKYNFKMCVIWAVVGLLTVSALQRTAWARRQGAVRCRTPGNSHRFRRYNDSYGWCQPIRITLAAGRLEGDGSNSQGSRP